jgi:hypothetical protein
MHNYDNFKKDTYKKVVICDLVDALSIALLIPVCAVSLQYITTKWGKVHMRIRPSAPGHITSHNRVTEIHKMVRILRLIVKKIKDKRLKLCPA